MTFPVLVSFLKDSYAFSIKHTTTNTVLFFWSNIDEIYGYSGEM